MDGQFVLIGQLGNSCRFEDNIKMGPAEMFCRLDWTDTKQLHGGFWWTWWWTSELR